MQDYKKIDYSKNKDVVLRYIPGHFIRGLLKENG